MARDVQITGGIGSAPQSYLVPNATEIIPRAINATFDGTGAAAAFLPTVEIVSDGGVVIARCPCSTTVAAGGSAEVSFYPFSEDAGGTATSYVSLVQTLGPSGTLRGYWRLGEVASPFADISAYVGGPSPATQSGSGTAYTTHVGGALSASQDDGALQFNAPVSGGYYLNAGSNPLNPSLNQAFTIAAWVKPFPWAVAFRGGVLSSQSFVAGSPGHEEGWMLEVEWGSGTTTAKMSRVINNVRLSAAHAIPQNTWTFLMGTYDGTNLRLYVNGTLSATTADGRADSATVYGGLSMAHMVVGPPATEVQYYGVIDEVALWSVVLDETNATTLFRAAF